jgi:hypothetical protein
VIAQRVSLARHAQEASHAAREVSAQIVEVSRTVASEADVAQSAVTEPSVNKVSRHR